jgi:hypothetical protein
MTTKILINNQVYSTETHYCPPYSHGQNGYKPLSLRINVLTETIYCNSREFKNYDELYNFLKEKDKSGRWLKNYHNFLGDEDGTYLDNMFFNLRRRYKIFLSKYDFSQNSIYL